MAKVKRESKFYHVFGEASKAKYDDLRISSKATEGYGITSNGKYVALAWEAGGGGAVACIPIGQTGRIPRDLGLISGHSSGVLDFAFNPFDDDMIATCSEDLSIKLWQIPEGGLKGHMKEPVCKLDGHGKKVSFVLFNPVADGILASAAFEPSVKVWNYQEGAECFNVPLPDQAWHLKWNWQGSLLAVPCKDKLCHIIDPRAGAAAIVCSGPSSEGSKPVKVEWLGSSQVANEVHKFVTTGFQKDATREIKLWDMRKYGADAACLAEAQLDNGTGALFPHWDDGTHMLYITGKGDGNCRFWEFTEDAPYMHFLSLYGTSTPQKGFCFIPKRACDTTVHEIMRGLKMEASSIVPVSFRVPRKSEAFQDDIFPDARAPVAAVAGDKWAEDPKLVKMPVMQSMKPGAASVAAKPKATILTVKDYKAMLAEAQAKIEALEKENKMLKEENAKLKK